MPLETAQYINGLDATNPVGSDPIAAGDDHLRLIKAAVKATFPNLTGPVNLTQAEINSAILADGSVPMSGPLVLSGNPTSSNQAANKAYVDLQVVAANASFPSGGIVMWSGSIASIPTGWALCNGTNGTPNLVDRFIVGAGSSYGVGATGGSANSTLIAHTHSISSAGSHTHSFNTGAQYSTADSAPNSPITYLAGTSGTSALQSGSGINSQGYILSAGDHTHSVTSAGTGSGSGDNLPPYFALAYIMKL